MGRSDEREKEKTGFRSHDIELSSWSGIAYSIQKKFVGRKTKENFMLYVLLCIAGFTFLQFFVYQKRSSDIRGSELHGLHSATTAYNAAFLQTKSSQWKQSRKGGARRPELVSDVESNSNLGTKAAKIARMQKTVKEAAVCMSSKLLAASYGSDSEVDIMKVRTDCFQTALVSQQEEEELEEMDNGRQDYSVIQQDKHETVPYTGTSDQIAVSSDNKLPEEVQDADTFLPLKDVEEQGLTDTDRNWFMSSIRGKPGNGFAEAFDFPREQSEGKLLCVKGTDTTDGTRNSYGFLDKQKLPPGSTLLSGVTLIADNYWDYENPWHSMSAMTNFATWRAMNECVIPERVVLYHWGQLVTGMGSWISNVLHASLGRHMEVDSLNYGDGPVCFERAIVHRRGLGGISPSNMHDLFSVVRCKVRKFCGITAGNGDIASTVKGQSVEITILTREGARAFSNASGVAAVVEGECKKVKGCRSRVQNIGDLTFCEQVGLMSSTDVLVTAHGAQMTNMMFMSAGGSVMEMYPKGWLEFAGIGQYIYQWLSDWAQIVHEGAWRDTEGPDCPYPPHEELKCLLFHKDMEVGLNATHLAQWTDQVLHRFLERKADLQEKGGISSDDDHVCLCDDVDKFY